MTNLQAIDLLKGLEQSLDDYCELNDEGKTAFGMAITALEVFGNSEQLPSAQPDLSSYSDKLWRAAYERGKAEARMRGRWVEVTDGTRIWKVCDQCGEKPLWNEWRTDRCESNFCPNCGAYMRGERDETDRC